MCVLSLAAFDEGCSFAAMGFTAVACFILRMGSGVGSVVQHPELSCGAGWPATCGFPDQSNQKCSLCIVGGFNHWTGKSL